MCTVAISYAWTSDAYEARVQSLATKLRSDGIYVILDKWELKFGHDVYAFMERLVADPKIRFVLMLCNSEYERKANARCGGAGTEAGLIAPTISGASRQTKYVPVLMERRPDNTPHIPAFLLGRFFADLSTPASEAAEYAKILNHIRTTLNDHTDTPLPAMPASIVSENRPSHNQSSPSLTNELAIALQASDNSRNRGQAAVNMIARLLPIRNRFIAEAFQALSSQREQDDTQLLAEKIEEILAIRTLVDFGNVTPTAQLDAFNFLMREIWLHTIAKLIKQRRWNTLKSILETHFAVRVGRSIEMVGYGHFFESLQLVDIEYNNEQETRRISVTADLLEARCVDSGLDFYELVEADFLLWIRSLTPPSSSNMTSRELWWFPNTLARFAEHPSPTPFPLAVRWQVGQQQEALIALFGVPSRNSLLGRLATDNVKSSIDKWAL